MKQFFEEPDYSDLKREVEALRKKIEELESGQVRRKVADRATCWRRLCSRAALALPAVIVAVLLALGALVAQNKQDPLFIDQNGNVGINQNKPESPLDVNGNALFRADASVQGQVVSKTLEVKEKASVGSDLNLRGKLVSAGDIDVGSSGAGANNSALYFKGTDHKHSGVGNGPGFAAIENSQDYNALMVLGRTTSTNPLTRVVGMWDRVGIGKKNPQAPLDVQGEIRGIPWTSQEYEWRKGNPGTQMTKADHSVCFLTLVSGYFYGGGEVVEITKNAQGYWVLGGIAEQRDVRAKARCIGAPDDAW
jgi:hypothetical protein